MKRPKTSGCTQWKSGSIYIFSTIAVSPTTISILLRVGWITSGVKERYIKFEVSWDHDCAFINDFQLCDFTGFFYMEGETGGSLAGFYQACSPWIHPQLKYWIMLESFVLIMIILLKILSQAFSGSSIWFMSLPRSII